MEHWRLHHPVHWQRDIETTFFKCTRWQLKETLDPGICPYHYYCYSNYPGDYPGFIDILVFAFVAASFLLTVVLSLMEMLPGRRQSELKHKRRYLLPSGPISLPVMLLILAKGHRINSLFPIISTGPAILQLIRVAALAFESETDSDIRRVHVLYMQKEDLGSGWNSDPLPGIVSHHGSGCLYFVLKNFLMTIPSPENALTQMVSFCGVMALLCLHILRRLSPWLAFLFHGNQVSKMQF